MSVASLYTPCFVIFCVFLYWPFCHGAHKLDLSILFTTFFLCTSLPFILRCYIIRVDMLYVNDGSAKTAWLHNKLGLFILIKVTQHYKCLLTKCVFVQNKAISVTTKIK